jgi:hypothetical protein
MNEGAVNMPETDWPHPITGDTSARDGTDVEVIDVVQGASSKRRRRLVAVIVIVATMTGAATALLIARQSSDDQYSLVQAAERVEGSKRFSVRTTTTFDDVLMDHVFAVDLDKGLFREDTLADTSALAYGLTHTVVDVQAQMRYTYVEDPDLPDPRWLGGAISSSESDYWQGQLNLAAQLSEVIIRGSQPATDLGVTDLDGQSVRHYQVSIDSTDAAATQSQPGKQIGSPTATFTGPRVYDVFVSESNDFERITMTATMNGQTLLVSWGQFAYNADVSIEVPSEFVDMTPES